MKLPAIVLRWLVLALWAGHAAAALPAAVPAHDLGPAIVHLLDYVGVDYPGTVKDGRVVDEAEYKEQLEFAGQAIASIEQLSDHPARADLLAQTRGLLALMQAKAEGERVHAAAERVRWALIDAYQLEVAPRQAPNLAGAARLFEAQCAGCHGASGHGDGPLGRRLDPAPADFHDARRMDQRSLYALYNTVTLGVAGTAMRGYKDLSDDERWTLVFHLATLRHGGAELEQGEAAWARGQGKAVFTALKELVTPTPAEVQARHGVAAAQAQAWLVAHPAALTAQAPSPLDITRSKLDASVQRYLRGEHEGARQLAIAAYLEGFEPIERSLDNVDAALRVEIEREMMALRSAIGEGASAQAVTDRVAHIKTLLDRAQERLAGAGLDPATAFFSALLILLREGLEAILVLAAIVAFVRKTGRRDAMVWIHTGWVAAVALGAITWLAANRLISVSGSSRELTEGVTALIAAGMLLYVGYWLHTKSVAQAWQHFIRDQVNTALGRGTLWAMAGVSFLAVYRELFEIVLFYESLWAQAGSNGQRAVLAGIGAAALLLALLAWIILKTSARLPIGPFFSATSGLLAMMAVVFAGHGVAALQEAGILGANPVHFVSIPVLGVHPTTQGLAAQLSAMALVALGMWTARRAARVR